MIALSIGTSVGKIEWLSSLFNSIPRLVALFVIVYQDLFVVGLAEKAGK